MKKTIFFLALLLLVTVFANSQSLGDYQFTTGHDASRWVTLDSTRNLLVIGSTRYYVRSGLEEIGFTFPFADSTYSQFSVTHDGNLRLGPVLAVSSSNNQGAPLHPSRANSNNPKINFMGCAGYTSDSAYVHKQLFGEAPNRFLVVEFALQTYASASRNSLLRWQVQLYENGDIQIAYPSQPPRILPNANRQQGLCVDASDLWAVDENHLAMHFNAGYSTYISPGHWPDTNRYYRFNYPSEICLSPSSFIAAAIDTSSVTLTWNNPSQSTLFQVECSSTASVGSGVVVSVTDTFVVFNGLQPGSQYHFFVRSVCGTGDTSGYSYIAARTLTVQPVSDFPFFCDFETTEDRCNWIIPAGNLTTNWFMGTAVNNTTQGQYALYISQDNGATNTGGDQWIGAYAYRDVNLESGDWNISFDWRAVGDWTSNSVGINTYYHFLRVFLVPYSVSFTAQTPPSFPSSPHSSAVPAGWIDVNPEDHVFYNQNTWTTYSASVNVPTSGCYHLVFYWETDGYEPGTDLPAAIDNVSLELLSCAQPQAVTAEVSEDGILLSWHRGGNENSWMLRYGGNEVYLQDTFYLASGLDFNTLYTFELFSVCGVGDTSLPTTAFFRSWSGEPVMQYPYFCDFEDSLTARQWVPIGDNQENQWYVGTAANNTPQGNKSLYVSDDGGTSNAYSGSAFSLSYAYRLFAFDSDEYVCSFDWRCVGDNDFHFMRAFIIPADELPSPGLFPMNTTYHHNAVPSGWIDLAPSTHYMSGENNWNTQAQSFMVPDSGLYALLFMWENDSYTPNNPPAAVDNIMVARNTCSIPTDLTASVLMSTVDLTWNATGSVLAWLVEYADTSAMTYTPSYNAENLDLNTEYTFSVRSLCSNGDTSLPVTLTVRTGCQPLSSLPFFCNFDEYTAGLGGNDDFIPCWNRIRNYANTFSPKISSDFTQGNNCLYWNLTYGQLDDAIVVLPEFDESIDLTYTELQFKAMKYDLMGILVDPVIIVGIMDDPYTVSTFQAIDTIVVSNSSSYVTYTVPMLNYDGFGHCVVMRGTLFGSFGSSAMCMMDDVELHELQYCRKPSALNAETGVDTVALSWSPGGNESQWRVSYSDTAVITFQPSYVARGLQPSTQYVFSVVAVCAPGDTSAAITGRYTTLSRPEDPQDTTVITDCLPVSDFSLHQDVPYVDHAYECTLSWSGTAAAYQMTIGHWTSDYSGVYVVDTVTLNETSYFFDAEGISGTWNFRVRAVCGDNLFSDWSDSIIFTTPDCIGFDSPDQQPAITLFPNPSVDGYVNVGTVTDSPVRIEINDLSGRHIMSISVNGNTNPVSLGPLAKGTYFVTIITPEYQTTHKLLVR